MKVLLTVPWSSHRVAGFVNQREQAIPAVLATRWTAKSRRDSPPNRRSPDRGTPSFRAVSNSSSQTRNELRTASRSSALVLVTRSDSESLSAFATAAWSRSSITLPIESAFSFAVSPAAARREQLRPQRVSNVRSAGR